MAFPGYKVAACLSGVACLVLSAHPAAAVEGGIFCKAGGVFFIERPNPDGSLTFKVREVNAQQHIIDVEGLAAPHDGGWRYQSGGAEGRCTLDIMPAAGGFKMDTVKGATCAGMGGMNAEIALMGASFPRSSRVKGAVPVVDNAGHIPEFDCDHKKFASTQDATPAARPAPRSQDGMVPEGPCLATTGSANASKLATECKAVSGNNKKCGVNVSCTDMERQIVAGCEVARKARRNYKAFCSEFPANLGRLSPPRRSLSAVSFRKAYSDK